MVFNLYFNLDELVQFLLKARKNSYLANSEKIKNPQRPGFKEFAPYKEGNFEYVDSYAGKYYAPGQEVIRFKETPVWNMAYNGGMIPKYHDNSDFSKTVFTFLKIALLKADVSRPFRGLNNFKNHDFQYFDESQGDITNFKGTERIFCFHHREDVFKQDYIGGLIIHK